MVTESKLEQLPVRVIDVQQTIDNRGRIQFVKPVGWREFDVISHTWTPGLESFQLDLACAVRLAQAAPADARSPAYERAFDSPNISGHSFVVALIQFLRVLHEHGVQKVWLDALCIDQTDEERNGEKDKEIPKMGLVYSRSRACYVCPHGIDGGYKPITSTEEEQSLISLPKWFSRVWTIQEFILPQKIYFIVAKFDDIVEKPQVKAFLDAQWGAAPAESRTKFDELREKRARLLLSNAAVNMVANEKKLQVVNMDDYIGLVCNQRLALTRRLRAQFIEVLHFVEEIIDVTDWRESKEQYKFQSLNTWRQLDPRSFDVRFIGDLGGYTEHVIDTPCRLRIPPETAFYRVKSRDSTNARDRVLSVLHLLGWECAQVDNSKDLRAQMVELGKSWSQQNMAKLLLNVCAVDSVGGSPGTSWAPNLEIRRRESGNLYGEMMEELYLERYAAQVLAVDVPNQQHRMQLRLLAKAYQAELRATGSGPYACIRFLDARAGFQELYVSYFDASTPNFLKLSFELRGPQASYGLMNVLQHIDKGSRDVGNLFPGNNGVLFGRIYLNARDIHQWGMFKLQCGGPAIVCRLWMVLLGYSRHSRFDTRYQTVMLCLREHQSGEMHKVGILIMKNYIDFSNTQFTEYLIGDLGDAQTDFLWPRPAFNFSPLAAAMASARVNGFFP